MRLYFSLAVTVLVAMLLLTACNSNDQSAATPVNAPTPVQSSNRPAVRPTNPQSVLPSKVLPANQTPLKPSEFPTPVTTPSPAAEEARRITPEELKSKFYSGQAILIDVRGEAAYNQSHIKGSRQIPYAEIAAHAGELPRNKLIVTYCS